MHVLMMLVQSGQPDPERSFATNGTSLCWVGNHRAISEGVCHTTQKLRTKNKAVPGDIYPPTVRRLKSLLVDGMLALVEGRLDSQIHAPWIALLVAGSCCNESD